MKPVDRVLLARASKSPNTDEAVDREEASDRECRGRHLRLGQPLGPCWVLLTLGVAACVQGVCQIQKQRHEDVSWFPKLNRWKCFSFDLNSR